MKFSVTALASILAFAPTAFAHYRWTSLIANSTVTGQYQYVRVNTNYNSPMTDVTSTDVRCNTGGLASGAQTSTATVKAGSTVGFQLDNTVYHPGPLMVYMSKSTTSSVSSYDGSGSWFKIAQLGATFANGQISFLSNGLATYNFQIPKSLPNGQYLLRIEQVGLHVASSANGAQFYLSCAQVNVVGGGSGSPAPTVKFPGAYKPTDSNLLINIYNPVPTSYTVPGPAVWNQ